MKGRPAWLCVWILCVGCQGPTAVVAPSPGSAPAQHLWEQGQTAIRQGKVEAAIHCYEQSLTADPTFTPGHLSLAAALLENGNDAEACPHLQQYLETNPGHLAVRLHYAELLLKLERLRDARTEFERFVADAQEEKQPSSEQLIHCHGRLVEIAEVEEDEYAEHLHRGIGLYLLSRAAGALSEAVAPFSRESLLCKAAAELSLARLERQDEARPCWYLYQVWSGLGQRQPALRSLHEADSASLLSYLTPAEQGALQLACRARETVLARK